MATCTKIEHANQAHSDWYVVNWCLGNTCTYSCSYCPEGLHNGSKAWPSAETVKKFILKIKESVAPRKVYFEFTGGEVTVYPEFIDVCKFCKDIDVKVGLISNGSRTVRWWEENKQYFDHVCLSFHPEEAKADHFIEIAKTIHNDLRTHINIMMAPSHFDQCYDVANRIKDIGNVSIALQPLIHDFGDTLFDYTDAQKEVFENQHNLITKHIKHTKYFPYYRGAMKKILDDGSTQIYSAHRFISQKENNWAGWDCYSGVEQLAVDMDGRVYIGWCKLGGAIGHINSLLWQVPTQPIRCSKTMCHCNYDIMSTKIKVNGKSNVIPIIAA